MVAQCQYNTLHTAAIVQRLLKAINMVVKSKVTTVAPATATPNTKAPVVPLFALGPKPANIKVAHNQLGWQAILSLLQANPNGVTKAQPIAVVTPNNGFAQYSIKNGWLAQCN